MIKHKDQKQQKVAISATGLRSHFIIGRRWGRNSNRSHGRVLLTVCSPRLAQSACLYTLTTESVIVPPTMSWALLYESLIKKMPHRLFYKPVHGGVPFLSCGSVFSDNSRELSEFGDGNGGQTRTVIKKYCLVPNTHIPSSS